ncbi:MAG: ATP-binding protein, partial [Caldisericaceae bacterium]|nr:ATP-binding protein [Caldisericaceae bacterium]
MEEGKKFDTGFPVPSLPEILIRKDSVKEKVFSASKFAYIYGEAGSGKTTFALSVSGKHPVYIKIPETKMQDISFIYSYFLSSELLNEDKFFEEPFYEFKREIVLQYILNKLIHKRRKVKIIVDDLHNLPENSEMFLFIKDLFRYASRNLFFIFVSRKNPPSFLLKEADRGVFIQSKELR